MILNMKHIDNNGFQVVEVAKRVAAYSSTKGMATGFGMLKSFCLFSFLRVTFA